MAYLDHVEIDTATRDQYLMKYRHTSSHGKEVVVVLARKGDLFAWDVRIDDMVISRVGFPPPDAEATR